MIESVMEEEEDQEIKDQQGGGATEEDLVLIPTETTTGIMVVPSAEEVEGDDDNDNVKKKSKESEFDQLMSKKVSVVDNNTNKLLIPNVVVVQEESEPPPQTCVIDVKCCSSNTNIVGNKLEAAAGGENCDVEKVCRICHLSVESPSDNSAADMIQLGCGCKDELGIAHRHCAETWFKLKGNRCCEICGQAAKNITGMWDDRFMEDWNERRSVGSNSLDRRWGFWRGQPFCNFLMACLVMAFVLPWFFRVNMF